ncbi:MAG TPA: type IV pilus assembly protein PilM [Actinobacteria bacterium]|nr:type IV pilus assembly protein PilM [Actinomycetota bacterium]
MGIFSFKASSKPIGLDIGTNTIRAAQLVASQGELTLKNYGHISVPRGALSDGEIFEPDVVANSLIELWKKARFNEKRVVVGVANQKVVVRLIELPFMQKEDLRGAVQFQAQEFIPIPVEEAILDFQVVGDFVNENEEHMVEILLVAAQKDMVEKNIVALEKAGLKPVAIDVSSFAIARSLLLSQPIAPLCEDAKEGSVAYIQIGAGITNIVIIENNVARFTRVSTLAGNDFTQSIVDSMNLPFDEAEDLKISVGLPLSKGKKLTGIPKKYKEKAEAIQEILEGEATKFVSELRRSFDFYLSQASVKEIKKIVLTGSGAMLRNFDSFIAKNLKADVSLGYPLGKIIIGPGLSKDEIKKDELSMAICLGLALREFE